MENLFSSNIDPTLSGNIPGLNSLKKTALFFVIGVMVFLGFFYYLFISAPNNFPKGIIVNIERGDTLREISFDLKEKSLIRSRVSFETFVILFGAEKRLSQGDYLFENRLPVFEIARRMVQKDRHLASLRITIPEGFDVLEISNVMFSQLRNFNKEKFLLEAKEGYLFPDTYFFFSSDTEIEVLKYLSENFEKKIKPLRSEIISLGKNENEIITMASIIEREAKGDADRGYVSGILWNRLSKGMPLQVDAAIETYKTKGLPKNPICNPGLKAIKASMYPSKSNYLYYLHDENGMIHYAKNFEEHKKNKLKYLK